MFSDRTTRGLLWKEIRLVIPLILILIAAGLALGAILTITRGSSVAPESLRQMTWMLPMLYALGCGAVLVGQEKEHKTLWWIASLPIESRKFVTSKLAASLLGLVVMWIVSLVFAMMLGLRVRDITQFLSNEHSQISLISGVYFVLVSVAILAWSLYASWRFQSMLTATASIIPLVGIGLYCLHLTWLLFDRFDWRWSDNGVFLATLLIAIAASVRLSFIQARKLMLPAKPPSLRDDGSRLFNPWQVTSSTTPNSEPNRLAISAILWQWFRDERWILTVFVLAIGLASGCAAAAWNSLPERDSFAGIQIELLVGGVLFAGWLATCWLGVYVFAGNGSARRMRFLADRGVSPSSVWLGRQMIGLSVLSIAILIYAGAMYSMGGLLSIATFAILIWVNYSVSQWSSQLIPSLGISLTVAPFLSGAYVYWLGYSVLELGMPLWVLLGCTLVPIATSWSMMRRFMDGHRGPVIWITSLVATVLLFVLPVVPFAAEVASTPGMRPAVRSTLERELESISERPGRQLFLADRPDDNLRWSDEIVDGDEALTMLNSVAVGPRERFEWPEGVGPISMDGSRFRTLLPLATYAKLAFKAAPDDQSLRDSLGDWIEAFAELGRRLRLDQTLGSQGQADLVEIWLTSALSDPSLKGLLGEPFAIDALRLIGDHAARNRGRREAVLLNWRSSTDRPTLGLDRVRWRSGTERRWLEPKKIDAITQAAIELIDAGSSGAPTESALRAIHQTIYGSRLRFEDGLLSERTRSSSDAASMNWSHLFCSYWYAPWEQRADLLASSVLGTKQTDPQSQSIEDLEEGSE